MTRFVTGRYVLLLFLLLALSLLTACTFGTKDPALSTFYPQEPATDDSKYYGVKNELSSSELPAPDPGDNLEHPSQAETISDFISLHVKNKILTLGEGIDSLLDKLGDPSLILDTEYDFDFYIYHNDYTKLVLVAVKGDKIAGWYTDSIDFNFKDIAYGSTLSAVNKILKTNASLKETLEYTSDHYTLTIFFDRLITEKVTGIFLLSDSVKEVGYNETIAKNMELILFDLTNSIRARNDLPVLSWSSSAAIAARGHSQDMLAQHYFSHTDLKYSSPGDRIRAEGIYFTTCGENIIKGYGNVFLSSQAWYNSQSHRDNLLNKRFRHLGIGFAYDSKSPDQTYITQNYYR